MRKTLAFVVVVWVAAGVALAACSSSSGGGDTGLSQALARIAATDATRHWVSYDATGSLTKLAGKQLSGTGYGSLLLRGTDLGPYARVLPEDTGVAPLEADYGISAGVPPYRVSVLVGGQQEDRVANGLTKRGWAKDGDRLVAPALNSAGDDNQALYTVTLAQVRTDGADVMFGSAKADLSAVGQPSGKTLAEDELTNALADCLGDVVVAQMTIDYQSPVKRLTPAEQQALSSGVPMDKLTEVAVGVRAPQSASDTARAVVCTAWSDQSAADTFATVLPKTLSNGNSLATNRPYAQLLQNPEITKVGGAEHIVQWSADEVNTPKQIIDMMAQLDLPALF